MYNGTIGTAIMKGFYISSCFFITIEEVEDIDELMRTFCQQNLVTSPVKNVNVSKSYMMLHIRIF
jgi:hypothetical protein